jgi:integrase
MGAISEKIVSELPSPETGNRLHYFSGAKLQGKTAPAGFAVRVTAAGSKSFVWFHRRDGKQYLETLGRWDEQGGDLSVLRAILAAQDRAKSVRDGDDPRPQRTRHVEDGKRLGDTVAAMFEEFLERHVVAKKQRSADRTRKTLKRLVLPVIGSIKLHELKRSHVTRMLDKIEAENGPAMKHRAFAIVRKAFNWQALRDEEFHSPIVKGMGGDTPKARERFLTEEEIGDLLTAVEGMKGSYPSVVRMLLLTACRREEVGEMEWSEISGDTWTIPAARYKTGQKTGDHTVPLTPHVQSILSAQPRKGPFVFSRLGKGPFTGWSKDKVKLDKRISELRVKSGRGPMPDWDVHDLRRTARTLMAKAGVPGDIAERVLGHKIRGIEGVYNQHNYPTEKRDALEKLAAMIERIVNPPPSNVATLGEHRDNGAQL